MTTESSAGEWMPANEVEQAMADALAAGDGPEYARRLRSARLLLPAVPEPGSEEEELVAELLPPDAPYIPVFTSPESLDWAFGDLIDGYEELDLATLLQRWPNPQHQLAVNPGSPIATYLPPSALTDLAEGRQSLAPIEDLREAVADETLAQIRQICLQELAGRAVSANPAGITQLRQDPPVNPLETALRDAVTAGDGQAYLHALLAGDPVLLLTGSPVDDPDQIFDEDFPWRVLGGDQAQAIAVFSSPEMLERTGGDGSHHIPVDFLNVLVNWPGEEYLLCVNPGSVLELMLPGDTVLEVVASMAEALEGPP